MSTPEIICYRPNKIYDKPHFFILNKGNNSGRPLRTPCPNCFVISFDNDLFKEQYYWLIYGLWQSRAFHPFLRGSVIPFIIKKDLLFCIKEAITKVEHDPELFEKAILTLKKIDELEHKTKAKLKLIDDAKRFIFRKYLPYPPRKQLRKYTHIL